jgi:hypothetical protein
MKKVIYILFVVVLTACSSNTATDNEPGNCTAPNLLNAIDITTTTATLEWSASLGNDIFNVEYGALGFNIGQGTNIGDVRDKMLAITGLTSGTQYSFYVRVDCGGANYSQWAGPFNFSTN